MSPTPENQHNAVITLKDKNKANITTISFYNEKINDSYSELIHISKTLYFIEDRNFENHFGLSVKGLCRALYQNLKHGRIAQGGSTITQQLVRTLFPIQNRFLRKLVEALASPIITLTLGRKKIARLYMKKVFFGMRIHGFNAASNAFLKKNANNITEIESFFIFSLLSKPNFWLKHPDSLTKKVNALIKNKHDQKLKASDCLKISRKISKNAARLNRFPAWFPKFSSYFSSFNLPRHSGVLPVNISLQKYLFKKISKTNQNVCFGIIDYKNFRITSLVDVLDMKKTSYPTLLSNFVEVGSLLKPFLAILCVRRGVDPSTLMFESRPITLKFEGFPSWEIKNNLGEYHGNISLQEGIAKSDNSVCAQAIYLLGLEDFCKILLEYNIITSLRNSTPSIVLGSYSHGINFLNLLRFYSDVAAMKDHTNSPFDQFGPTSKCKSNKEFIAVRKCLKQVVKNGTGNKLFPYRIIGAKTGTSGKYKTLICFDREQLYFTIHKEKEDFILNEQYLDEIFKSYGAVSFTTSILKDIKRFFIGMTNPNELYGKNRWAA